MSYTYHFGLNGKPIAIEKRYEGVPDLVLTQKNTNESELLKSLSPRINEVLKTCSVPQNQSFSIEESQDTNY